MAPSPVERGLDVWLDGGMFSFGSNFHLGGRHFSNDGCHDLKLGFKASLRLRSKA
jgi:hypothetical protein